MKQLTSILIFCIYSIILTAQIPPIDISQMDSSGVNLDTHIQFFEDYSTEKPTDRIPHLPIDSFKSLPEKHDFLKENRNCWLKVELINSAMSSKEIMLHYTKYHAINLFLKSNEGRIVMDSAFHSSETNFLGGQRRFVLLNVKPHATITLLFHKKGYSSIDFKRYIYSDKIGWKANYEEIKKTFTKNIFRIGFLFIIGALSLLNFLQYFQHKDHSYLLYSLYLLVILLTFLWRHSLYFYTPFSDMLAGGWDIMYAQNHYLVILFYMLFFRSFLSLNQSPEKKLHKWLTYSLWIIIFFMAIDVFLIYNDFIALARAVLNNGIPLMMIGFSVLLWKIFQLPYAATRYIGFGSVALFIMAIISRWKFWGKYFVGDDSTMNIWPFYIEAMPFGILVEITFFSLALGYRTKMIKKEKEIEAAKSRLFANITHEFRTPLTVIKGNTNLILKNPKKQLAERVEVINYYADTLEYLVDDLLDLSKIAAGQMQLTKYQGDVIHHLNYLVESLSSYASDNKVRLSFHADIKEWTIDFSPQALQQILSNLISNALKFTPEHGQVKVIVQKYQNQLLIKVTDTGKGIKETDLSDIFEPNFQADQSIVNKVKGTGLGLAIVRGLVKTLDGQINVESQLKQGTTFTILLPVTKEASPISKDKLLPAKKPLIRQQSIILPIKNLGILPKMLIVEDNPDVLNYFVETLQRYFTIITASDGEEGLELAQKEQPDFIISDEMMPEKSGFEMLKELKESPNTQHIPVVIITAKADRESMLEALSLQAEAHLPKPLDKDKLLLILQNLQAKKEQINADKNLIRWQGKVVTNPFMKATLLILTEKHATVIFNAKSLKIELQRKGFGGDRKIDKLIKEHFKTTPASFLRDYRLAKAMYYLQHGNSSIPEIIDKIGLGCDQANFTKMFSNKFGITPASVRK